MRTNPNTLATAMTLGLTLLLGVEAALAQLPPGPRLPVPPGPKTRVTAVSSLQIAPAATAGRLTLTWGPAAAGAVASYEVFRVGGVVGGATELIATFTRGETSLEQPVPTPGGPVGYQVVANNVDQTRDVSPWINYAPPPMQATTLSIAPNYNKPTLSWQEIPGVRYKLVKTLQPGDAAYPPISIFPLTASFSGPSPGGPRALSESITMNHLNATISQNGVPLADLHAVTHFQLNSDNGRGEVISGQWIAYAPTPHVVTAGTASYWVVPRTNGTREMGGCFTWTQNPDVLYRWSLIYGSNTQWPAVPTTPPVSVPGLSIIGSLAPGELPDPVRVRFHAYFFGVLDNQHFVEITLPQVQQAPTTCP